MSAARKKQILFVDDEAPLLEVFSLLFGQLSQGRWEITTAQNHAEALAVLQARKVDLVVLDIGMPVMDGVQFLKLLGRTHPALQVVMLTGMATDERRNECLNLGAALFLEKPTEQKAFAAVFAALDALASALPQEGFRGVMRQVGLQEVLQMECLGTKSSVLEIFTSKVRGKIFILDGSIIHAECGQLQGDVALYSLLALRGGGFNLLPFTEPNQRTIEGSWEFLLMEAARLRDEGGEVPPPETEAESPVAVADIPDVFAPAPRAPVAAPTAQPAPAPTPVSGVPSIPRGVTPMPLPSVAGPQTVRIVQTVLWSGGGELLHAWQCPAPEAAKELLEFIEAQAGHISTIAGVGRFDRLEVITPQGRVIAQLQSDRRLLVQSEGGGAA